MGGKLKCLFDLDGTLIKETAGYDTLPIYQTVALLESLYEQGHMIYISSGGGIDYAYDVCQKIGLDFIPKDHFIEKSPQDILPYKFDLSIDNELSNWGKVTLVVCQQETTPDPRDCSTCDGKGWLW